MNRILLLCIVFMALAFHATAAESPYSCEASPSLQEEIKLANTSSIDSLLSKYPDDFWVQRRYIELKTGIPYAQTINLGVPVSRVESQVIERFKVSYEKNKDNPESAFLYAYSLIHTDTEKSLEILTDITRKTPSFPSPWFTLSILHGYENFLDREKADRYTEAFIARCPETLETRIASNALRLSNSDVLDKYIQSLRKRIEGKEDQNLLLLYNYLWQLELKFAPTNQVAFYKERIRKDLKFIEGLGNISFSQKQSLLTQGYRQIGDQQALDRLIERSPASSSNLTLFVQAQSEWTRSNPAPPPNVESEKFIAYFEKKLEFLEYWENRLPDTAYILEPLFQASASIPGTTDVELVYTGSRILSMAERSKSEANTQAALMVLETWADRDILLHRIPELVRKLVETEPQTSLSLNTVRQSDLFSTGNTEQREEIRQWKEKSGAMSVLSTVHTREGRIDQARNVLAEWDKELEAWRRKVDAYKTKEMEAVRNRSAANSRLPAVSPLSYYEFTAIQGLSADEAKFYEGNAKLAVAEERFHDALTFYQSSIRLLLESRWSMTDFRDLERRKTAGNQIWNQLGGNQNGWDAWIASMDRRRSLPGLGVPRQAMNNRAIPSFSLSDQNGNTWTLAALKGKTTILNVWATWCGPCVMELPHLQKLHEKIMNRTDIQVIALNIDQDTSKVQPFLKDNRYTFPSLYANSFVRGFAGSIGIPTTWIVDSQGNIRFESLGFRNNGDRWVDEMLGELETVGRRTVVSEK